MPAPAGNDFKVKYKTPEERKAVFEQLLQHLREGWGESYFPPMSLPTIRKYFRDYPEDFRSDQYEEAKREGQFLWQKRGADGTLGKIPFFNAKTYQFIMMNQYGQTLKTEAVDSSVQEIKDKIRAAMEKKTKEEMDKTETVDVYVPKQPALRDGSQIKVNADIIDESVTPETPEQVPMFTGKRNPPLPR